MLGMVIQPAIHHSTGGPQQSRAGRASQPTCRWPLTPVHVFELDLLLYGHLAPQGLLLQLPVIRGAAVGVAQHLRWGQAAP
jgi:hypothetical protein